MKARPIFSYFLFVLTSIFVVTSKMILFSKKINAFYTAKLNQSHFSDDYIIVFCSFLSLILCIIWMLYFKKNKLQNKKSLGLIITFQILNTILLIISLIETGILIYLFLFVSNWNMS